MGYKVRYLVKARETGTELVSDFETAKTIVKNYAIAGTFNSAEVIDSEGKVIFHRPRMMRRA